MVIEAGHGNVLAYRVDDEDMIVSIASPRSWDNFAVANDQSELLASRVVGKSLWDFIQDMDTEYLYTMLLTRIRQEQLGVMFPFRCDSPDHRRFMEMTMSPLSDGTIEFQSRILAERPRSVVELLSNNARREETFLECCSLCKRFRVDPDRWLEVEEAVEELELFGRAMFPKVSHTVCAECMKAMEGVYLSTG